MWGAEQAGQGDPEASRRHSSCLQLLRDLCPWRLTPRPLARVCPRRQQLAASHQRLSPPGPAALAPLPPAARQTPGSEGQRPADSFSCRGKGFRLGWGCCLRHPSDPIIQTPGWGFSSGTEAPPPGSPLALLSLVPSPENCSDTDTAPRDHIMRQTPVCPALQWELPLALTGTMTSDLKFLERKCGSSRL